MRILIADDDRASRILLERLLQGWGYDDIQVVSNGEEAWGALHGPNPPALLLLDWIMPGLTGPELCRKIRARKTASYAYIILVSANTDSGDLVEGLNAGADDYMVKPIKTEELRSRIEVGLRMINYERKLAEKTQLLDQRNVAIRRYAQRMEQLALERGLYHQAFNDSAQPMFIMSTDGVVEQVNQALIDQYGYDQQELIGDTPWKLTAGREEYVHLGVKEEDYTKLFGGMWEHIINPDNGSWQGVIANQTKDGRIVWVKLDVSAIHDDHQQTIGFLGTPVDISDRMEKEFHIRMECYRAITDVAEARDEDTGMHLRRVSELCRLVTEQLGMPRRFIEDMATFSPLHDIGKVGIPDNILLAPRRLSDDEFTVMKRHTIIGYEILKDRATLELGAEIALTHHEKFNGCGYPRGLSGKDIPLCGRIVSPVDVYDALRSERPYKQPWTHERTMELICSESGKHFDPEIVEAFLAVETEIQTTFEQLQDTQEDIEARCEDETAMTSGE